MLHFILFYLSLLGFSTSKPLPPKNTTVLGVTQTIYTDSLPPSPTCTYYVAGDITLQGNFDLRGITFLLKSDFRRNYILDKQTNKRIKQANGVVFGPNIRLCRASVNLDNCTLAAADSGMWGGVYLADSSSQLRLFQTNIQDSYNGIVQTNSSQIVADQSHFLNNYVSLQLAGNRDTVRYCSFSAKPKSMKMPFDSVATTDYYYSFAHIKNAANKEIYLHEKQFFLNLFLNALYGISMNQKHHLRIEESHFYGHQLAAIYHQNGDLQVINQNEIHLPTTYKNTFQMQTERRKQGFSDSTTYGICASQSSVSLSGKNIFNSPQNTQTATKSHKFKHIGIYSYNCKPVTTEGENAFLRLQTGIQLVGGRGNNYALVKNYFYNCQTAIHLNKTDSLQRFLSLRMACNEFVKDCKTSTLPQPNFYGLILEGNHLVNGVYHQLGLIEDYADKRSLESAGNEIKANVNSVRVERKMLLYVPENFIFISNRCQREGQTPTLKYTRYSFENVILAKSENVEIQEDMGFAVIRPIGCMSSGSMEIPKADLPVIFSTNPVLYQNTPNPFGYNTTIGYAVPATTELTNTDLQMVVIEPVSGKILRQIALKDLTGTIELNTEGLASGMYVYALTSNGSILATKKMVVAR